MFEGFFQKNQRWKGKLREALKEYFSETELREICFDLGFDYESLHAGAGDKSKFVMELINQSVRQGRIDELISVCKRQRPNVDWMYIEKGARGERRFLGINFSRPRWVPILIGLSGLAFILAICVFGGAWILYNEINNPANDEIVFLPNTPTPVVNVIVPIETREGGISSVIQTPTPIVPPPPTFTPYPYLGFPVWEPRNAIDAEKWFPVNFPSFASGPIRELKNDDLYEGNDLVYYNSIGRITSYDRTYSFSDACNSSTGLETIYIQAFFFKEPTGARTFMADSKNVIRRGDLGEQSYSKKRATGPIDGFACRLEPDSYTFQKENVVYRVIVYTREFHPQWSDEAAISYAISIALEAERMIP